MNDKEKVIVDFKDPSNNFECCMTKGNKTITISKSAFMLELIKLKKGGHLFIQKHEQIITNINYLLLDVYKFNIVFPDRSEMVIKNVLESDIYFRELEAMEGIGSRIYLEKKEIYPDFPIKNDDKYDDKLHRKRYR